MPREKGFKRTVRARMEKTGERYTTARAQVDKTHKLTVRVTANESHDPIAGARVTFVIDDEHVDRRKTDGRGVAVVTVPAHSEVRCMVIAQRRHTWQETIAVDRAATLDVILEQGGVIGRVREGQTPIADAEIELHHVGRAPDSDPGDTVPWEGRLWRAPVRTDEDGCFVWPYYDRFMREIAPDLQWVLTVEHPRYEPAVVPMIECIEPNEDGFIEVNVDAKPGHTLTGLLTDAGGAPAANATVVVRAAAHPRIPKVRFTKRATADQLGTFAIDGLPAGTHDLRVSSTDLQARTEQITIPNDRHVEYVLQAGSTVRGRVVKHDGAPKLNELVWAKTEHGILTATSDARGTFAIPGLPANGHAEVMALGAHAHVELPPGEDVELREVTKAHLQVELTEEDGAALSITGWIHARGAMSLGAKMRRGRANLELLPGSYELEVMAHGRVRTSVQVELPRDERITIPMSRGLRVDGTVVDSVGQALGGATIRASGRYLAERQVATTHADGTYELEGLTAETVLAFTHDGYAPTYVALEEVMPETRLTKGASLKGVVTHPNGSRAENIPVEVRPKGLPFTPIQLALPATTTDRDGNYRIDHVPTDAVVVIGGFEHAVPLADREDVRLDVTLPQQ